MLCRHVAPCDSGFFVRLSCTRMGLVKCCKAYFVFFSLILCRHVAITACSCGGGFYRAYYHTHQGLLPHVALKVCHYTMGATLFSQLSSPPPLFELSSHHFSFRHLSLDSPPPPPPPPPQHVHGAQRGVHQGQGQGQGQGAQGVRVRVRARARGGVLRRGVPRVLRGKEAYGQGEVEEVFEAREDEAWRRRQDQ